VPKTNITENLVKLLQDQDCLMIGSLANKLQCSVPSVRRYLTKVGYYRSFTHNGKWYTLSTTPRFSKEGLWFSEEIGFSREGSMLSTLVYLVNRSSTGMTAEMLGERLNSRCHAVLVDLYRQGKLYREKIGRSFVYYSVNAKKRQQQERFLMQPRIPHDSIPAEVSLLIFADFIRNPNSTFELLSKSIERVTNIIVTAPQIEFLFESYGLKKTILMQQ
jgi:hypothetical protein